MSRAAALPALLAALAFSFPAAAERTVTVDGRGAAAGCSGVHIHFGDRVTARGEETVTLSRAEAKGLVLEGSRHGGITVRGGDANQFAVTACTAAAGDDDASARAALAKIALRTSGGRVTLEGPEGEHWSGFLLVTAPRDADFTVEASNGPVSLTDLTGTLAVRAANGPVSLSGLTGSVDVDAANGPVSLKGSSGEIEDPRRERPAHDHPVRHALGRQGPRGGREERPPHPEGPGRVHIGGPRRDVLPRPVLLPGRGLRWRAAAGREPHPASRNGD